MLGLLKVFIADPTRISNEHAHTTAWSAHTDKTGPTDVPRSFRDVLEERDKEQRGKGHHFLSASSMSGTVTTLRQAGGCNRQRICQ